MLLITLGDPLSVNLECLAQILNEQRFDFPLIAIGNPSVFRQESKRLGMVGPWSFIQHYSEASHGLNFLSVAKQLKKGNPEELSPLERGQIAAESLLALRGIPLQGAAILTSPIDKYWANKAGFEFPGQTEFCSDLAQSPSVMILAGPKLKVGLVTNHLALKDVSPLISRSLVEDKLRLFISALRETYGIDRPRVGVTGLNPHCSDGGMFGNEEQDCIEPAISYMQSLADLKAEVSGPIPADTAFFRCFNGELDGVLSMYHDQGLGPLKTVHFYDAVNITGGLPFLRVSPDHGPAVDKYGKGCADIRSFALALELCKRYLHDRSL